jgi:DNA modification methylase
MGEQQMRLINADCIEAMKAMPDNSVDSIVTDPPYELGFMGKSWDASGIAFNVEVWQEALRVIKPGGHLIAFSGSRTYHRMAVAIEDAGFQIRDQIMWVYGSGFPKSHNISKGIDKAAGAEREILGVARMQPDIRGNNYAQGQRDYNGDTVPQYITAPATAAAQQWDGWGTALKPAHEPMVLARKPLEGTVANNVLTHGVGGLNIDGTRVGTREDEPQFRPASASGIGNGGIAYGTREGQDATYTQGRFPANFIHDGSDEVVALFPDTKSGTLNRANITAENKTYGARPKELTGEYEANSGSAARFFYCAKASKRDRNEGLDGFEEIQITGGGGLTAELREDGSLETASAGGKYGSIKAKKANHHPTVKPTSLMQYLVRLVTPPNGVVLDPFMGSGSTGKACAYEGFDFIGIDQSAEYVAIAQARIDFALADKSDELPL